MAVDLSFDDLQALTPIGIVNYIQEQKLNVADTNSLIANWVLATTGKTQRVFNYQEAFPAQAPACVTNFRRGFAHQDWIDGESVVQAGQTSMEDGFNIRFHEIEGDIDALGQEIANAFVCLRNMRASLSVLLGEIRAEINRLNKDVFDLTQQPSTPVTPSRPVFDGKLVGGTLYKEKPYQVFQYEDGRISLIPQLVNPPPVEEFIYVAPVRTVTPRDLTDFVRVYAGDDRMTELLRQPGGVTKDEIIEKLKPTGAETGVDIQKVIDVLPDDQTRYENFDGLMDALSNGAATVIRDEQGAVAVGANMGVGRDVLRIEDAPVDRLPAAPAEVAEVLKANGVNTVQDVQNLEPARLQELLRAGNVDATTGDVLALKANANLLLRL